MVTGVIYELFAQIGLKLRAKTSGDISFKFTTYWQC